MMHILDPRLWIAAITLCAASFFIGYWRGNVAGKTSVQAQWTADIAAREKAQQVEKAKLEMKYAESVKQAIAQRDNKLREVQSSANASRAAVVSLREQLAKDRGNFANATPASVIDYATATGDVFAECAQEYQRVAEKADGHALDAEALIAAWPGQ